jgi:hypothetical protein
MVVTTKLIHLQRPPLPLTPPPTPPQGVAETAEAFNMTHLTQVPPQTSLSFHTLDPLSVNVDMGFEFGGLDTIAAR